MHAGGDGLLGSRLPAPVVVTELFDDPAQVRLYPQEAELMARAVDGRRREFATVRHCARTALGVLGVAPGPIVPAPDTPAWAARAPRWPRGVVGSMTHCAGYRAAAVALRPSVASVGVDAEINVPLPEGLGEYVMHSEERGSLERLAGVRPEVAWDRLMFSAKESVYKAWYPLTGRWLEFKECRVVPDPHRGTFAVTLLVPGPVVDGVRVDRFTGWWCTRIDGAGRGHVATAVVVPGAGTWGDDDGSRAEPPSHDRTIRRTVVPAANPG